MAPHSRILAWKIPWAEESGRPQSTVSQRAGHVWVTEHIQISKVRQVHFDLSPKRRLFSGRGHRFLKGYVKMWRDVVKIRALSSKVAAFWQAINVFFSIIYCSISWTLKCNSAKAFKENLNSFHFNIK